MLLRATIVIVVLAVVPLPATADEKASPPTGPMPTFTFISKIDADKGQAIAVYVVSVPVLSKRVETAVDPATGDMVEVEKRVVTYRSEQRMQVVRLDDHRFVTGGGKELKQAEALKRLAGKIVVIAPQGMDPAYQKLFKENTLILLPRKKAEDK